MSYNYIKSRKLEKNEKRSLKISVSTERHLAGQAQRKPTKTHIQRLLKLIRTPNTKNKPVIINWLLTHGSPKLITKLMASLSSSNVNQLILNTIKNSKPLYILPREYISPDFQKIQKKKNPKTALVCFTGNSKKLNIPVQLFHFLVANNFDLIFYLRDPKKQFFTQGIENIAANETQLMEFLEKQIPADCHTAVLGTSSGCYAAFRFAEKITPNRLVMFSPPLTFKNVSVIKKTMKTPLSNIRMYFGGLNELDCKYFSDWSTTRYIDSLRLFDTKSHGTLRYLYESGNFNKLVDWLLGGAEIPPIKIKKSFFKSLIKRSI